MIESDKLQITNVCTIKKPTDLVVFGGYLDDNINVIQCLRLMTTYVNLGIKIGGKHYHGIEINTQGFTNILEVEEYRKIQDFEEYNRYKGTEAVFLHKFTGEIGLSCYSNGKFIGELDLDNYLHDNDEAIVEPCLELPVGTKIYDMFDLELPIANIRNEKIESLLY
jgi:hypothetical protein